MVGVEGKFVHHETSTHTRSENEDHICHFGVIEVAPSRYLSSVFGRCQYLFRLMDWMSLFSFYLHRGIGFNFIEREFKQREIDDKWLENVKRNNGLLQTWANHRPLSACFLSFQTFHRKRHVASAEFERRLSVNKASKITIRPPPWTFRMRVDVCPA